MTYLAAGVQEPTNCCTLGLNAEKIAVAAPANPDFREMPEREKGIAQIVRDELIVSTDRRETRERGEGSCYAPKATPRLAEGGGYLRRDRQLRQ